jgi:ABC-2 type transport system ATP-binding protein
MEQAEKLCDHIGLIANGRVVLQAELATLKREQGRNRYRLVADGDLDRLPRVPGIAEVAAGNGGVTLRTQDGIDPAALLREVVSFLSVREFRSAEPTLEEIFVKAVRDANL